MSSGGQQQPSVVIVTREGSEIGGTVLAEALARGLPVREVIVKRWGTRERLKRWVTLARRYGFFKVTAARLIESLDELLLKGRRDRAPAVEAIARPAKIPLHPVPALNSEEMVSELKRQAPDLILLAGVGIIQEPVIRCARLGVLNGHPGRVPRYRGNYVVRWAIHDGAPVGITVHLVDTGIDTGDVLIIEDVPLPRTRSLREVEAHVDHRRAEVLVQEAERFLSGRSARMPQVERERHPLCTYMPLRALVRTYRILWKQAGRS